MFIAERMNRMLPSGIRKVNEKALAMERAGETVIHFESGRPDFDTPAYIKDAAKASLDEGHVFYTSNFGIMPLREEIAKKLKRENGLDYTAQEVLVCAGLSEAVFAVLATILEEGDELLVPDPGWINYVNVPLFLNAVPVYYRLLEENEYQPDLDEIRSKITDKTRAIVLTTPSNPTGGILSEDTLKELAQIAIDNDILVISDEVYERLVFDGEKAYSIATLPGMKERTFTMNGFSKTYSMTGWRLGYVAAPEEYIKVLNKFHQHNSTCAVSFCQDAAIVALRDEKDEVQKMVEEYVLDNDSITAMIEKIGNDLGGIYGLVNHCPGPKAGAFEEMGLVIKEKDRPRCILTELGEIKFSRDYYYNKKTGSYETPIDHMLSIQQRARIGDTISAKLVTSATGESYERSTQDVTGGLVSRQSVRNQILKAPELEKQPETKKKKQRRTLDVYADEDHVHLQKPGKEKGKKNKIVPLVTVTEGTVNISKGRNITLNPMHFVDENMDSKGLWDSVEGYIGKVYDIDALEVVRIHGDGGQWIKNGLENFANVEHVLDGYHLQKYLRSINNRFPGHKVRCRINEALGEDDHDKVEAIIAGLVKLCKSEKDFEKVKELQTYLFSNWEAAVNRFKKGVNGSCTEGQVSHVLSERFSRNPMGWSEEGLGKLSKLRVFCKNGGEITAAHFKCDYKCNETYKAYAKHYLEDRIGAYDLSWMSELRENYIFDTASGTQQAIKHLGKLRNDVFC